MTCSIKTFIVAFFLFFTNAHSAESIDQSNTTILGIHRFTYNENLTQSFTAGSDADLIAVEIPLSKFFNPTYLDIFLYATDENESIIGDALASGRLLGTAVTGFNNTQTAPYARMTFNVPYQQTKGEKLLFYFKDHGPTDTDAFYMGYSTTQRTVSTTNVLTYRTIIRPKSVTSTGNTNLGSSDGGTENPSLSNIGSSTDGADSGIAIASSSNSVIGSTIIGAGGSTSTVSSTTSSPTLTSNSLAGTANVVSAGGGGGGGCLLKKDH